MSHSPRPRLFPASSVVLLAFFAPLPAAISAAAPPVAPRPLVSPIFGDHMVLQRGNPNTFWGWSTPGRPVRVEIEDKTVTAVAASDGRWHAQIQPPAVGGPYTVTIEGDHRVALHDVLVGDVWLCGGQSNMYLGLGESRGGAAEIAAADHPNLRLFTVAQSVSYAPAAEPKGAWLTCTPETAGAGGWGGFSAVAYFFGRRLQEELHVPIGLIEDCVGGSPAESWMSPAALGRIHDFDAPLAALEKLRSEHAPAYGSFLMHWLDRYDLGAKEGASWAAPDWPDSDWKTAPVPGAFAALDIARTPVVCWLRRTFVLPDPLPAGPATLFLGSIQKMDTTYLNGQWVGASSWAENPRVYAVPAGALKPGKNVLAIRVFKQRPGPAFVSSAATLRLAFENGPAIPLAGDWRARVSVDARPPHPLPLDVENYPTMPAALYLGMIAPVAPLALRGFIWYQGAANASRAYQYRTLLPALIADWRARFGQGDLPFYIVSLPAFMHRRDQPGDDAWAELREAQARTAAHVAHTGLAVTIDTGDADNIHPQDKKPVGERLALQALAGTYGRKISANGPMFHSVERLAHALKLHFIHADGGLKVQGDRLAEFSVAGSDRVWHWAEARIEGDTIVVSSPDVPAPVAARYAWQANPAATLYNGAGLPAVPFRTDDWPAITAPARPAK
jgi:sialate O-acetylesterase